MTSRGVANTQVVRGLFDAIASGDLEAIRQVFAPDVTFTIPGSFRLAGVLHGRDEFLRGLGQLVQASKGTLHVELVNTAVNGLARRAGHRELPRHRHGQGRDNR